MRADTRLQNFLLPMVAGAVLALPVFFLTRTRAGASSNPANAAAEVEPVCGPFVESFTAMRTEADRIAALAASIAAPLEDGEGKARDAVSAWAEIAASSRTLESWLWEANDPNAPLNLREDAVVAGVTPIASELEWDAEDIADQLRAPMSEDDAARVAQRMDSLARAAAGIARALDPLTTCRAQVISYSPRNDCESRDPEYQYAMSGACLY